MCYKQNRTQIIMFTDILFHININRSNAILIVIVVIYL